MPTINSKESLGELFGGKIASINYNFQTSSSPASATLTVLSEENEFILPDFGELVSIPPFGLQMNVLEFTERKDSKKRVLQVELQEVSSEVLDKELVLIYGIHSDLDYNLNNDKYTIVKGSLVPQSFYPENSIFNSFMKFPSLKKDFIKDFGNGVNLIGSSRATFVKRFPIQITGVSDLPSQDDEWITFTAGSLSPELSSFQGTFIYGENESGDINTKFGYTLYNLYKLIESKGIQFDDSSKQFMSDESFFFSESGNIREVLSACLSKLGRSFYVDPLSQKIVVISNKDISQINTLLLNEFSNFTNTSAATQLSLTKSIRDVEANHFVLKGDLDSLNNRSGNNKGARQKPPRARKQKFYKLKDDFLIRGLNADDVRLFELLAPLMYGVADEETLDLFVYGLLKASESYNGQVYSKDEDCDFKEFEKKEKINRNEVVDSNPPPWQRTWELFEAADEEITLNGFFNYKNAVGAYEQFSGGNPEVTQPVTAPSSTQLYNIARNFVELWAGTYFSVAMTENQINQKSFISQAKFVGGLLNTYDFVPVKRDELIAQVPEMQFLFNLLKWANEMSERDIKMDYTVGEIADFATEGALGSDNGEYVMLAKRKLFDGVDIDGGEVEREMKQNFLSFDVPEEFKSYLMVTKNELSAVQSIIKKSEKAFQRERKKVKDTLVAKYIKVDSDEGDDNDSGGSEEPADILSLRNFQSKIKNFAKRTLTVIAGPIFETNLFLENINELNPQFQGPFVSTKVSYFRPPIVEDFQIEKGVQSISSSISNEGVTTEISYSSKKFAKVDKTFIAESLGTQRSELMKASNRRAFIKNKLSE